MAYISVSNTFSNGSVADAGAVNTNFTDIINGVSDGTKDISIAALTAAGATLLNGAVTLGNTTGDDITVTGYIASALIPKTDDAYDIGTSALAWQDAYLEGTLYTDAIAPLGTTIGISAAGAVSIGSTGAGVAITTHSTAGDDFTVNSTAFVVEGDTGKVGIGTTSPSWPASVGDGKASCGFKATNTQAVSSAATIYTAGKENECSLCLVHGVITSGTAGQFFDLVLFSDAGDTITVLHSSTTSGSPEARTYTYAATSKMNLAIGSSAVADVTVLAIAVSYPD